MPNIDCPINGCTYSTGDVDAAVAAALLMVHNNAHTSTNVAASKQKAPKIQRPSISRGSNEELWNTFQARWKMFKEGTAIKSTEVCQQLFEWCGEELDNDLLRNNNSDTIMNSETDLLSMIKRLAVIPVAISVRRSQLLNLTQCDSETVRSFFARIRGKTITCNFYCMRCM